MTKDPVRFKILFTRDVTFRDCTGAITHEFKIGDSIEATHEIRGNGGGYFVTAVGGIYYDEAKRI